MEDTDTKCQTTDVSVENKPVSSSQLRADLELAGYYPALVADVLDVTVAGEDIVAHLVHPETTFHGPHVRRHVTALVLTKTRLIVAHVDDYPSEDGGPVQAAASTETIPLRRVRTVGLTHVVASPEHHVPGELPVELTLAIAWGTINRIEIEPASCADPNCEADHGMAGSITPDDIVLRVSAEAEGQLAVAAARDFAGVLSRAVANLN